MPALPDRARVSVVVPALNEERYIGACLESLGAQTYPADLIEVLVADGGSDDATRAIVAAEGEGAPFPVRIIDNPGRTTPAGLNAGVRAAVGDVIIILGAHATAEPRFVEAAVAALRASGASAAGGPIETVGEGPVAEAIAAAMSHPFGVGDARFRYATDPGYVDTIAFAAYRRECFDLLGGFPVDRVRAEDDFFNYEVRRAGGKLYLTPEVRSTYYARATFRGLARQYFGYGEAKGRAAVDEPASVRPRHLVPLAAVVGGGLLAAAALALPRARLLLGGGTMLYGVLAAASAVQATRGRDRRLAPLTAVAFPLIHTAYGFGSALGILRASGGWRRQPLDARDDSRG